MPEFDTRVEVWSLPFCSAAPAFQYPQYARQLTFPPMAQAAIAADPAHRVIAGGMVGP